MFFRPSEAQTAGVGKVFTIAHITNGRFFAFLGRLYLKMIKYTQNTIKCLKCALKLHFWALWGYCCIYAGDTPPPRYAANNTSYPFSKFFIFYFFSHWVFGIFVSFAFICYCFVAVCLSCY